MTSIEYIRSLNKNDLLALVVGMLCDMYDDLNDDVFVALHNAVLSGVTGSSSNDFMLLTPDEFNTKMRDDGIPAMKIISSLDKEHFHTNDSYIAYVAGRYRSADDPRELSQAMHDPDNSSEDLRYTDLLCKLIYDAYKCSNFFHYLCVCDSDVLDAIQCYGCGHPEIISSDYL